MRVILTTVLLLAGSAAMAAPSVKIASDATVKSPVIRLGDVASFSGIDRATRKRLSRIALGRSPLVGRAKYVPRAYVVRRVRETLGRSIKVEGPDRFTVKRSASMLKGEALTAMIRAEVESRIPYELTDVARIHLPTISDIRAPAGSRARVEFGPGEDFDGPATADLIIEDGANRVSTRRVSIRVDRFVNTFGVRKELRRGHRLTRSDLVALRVPSSTLPSDVIERPEFVEGAELRRRAKVGEPLRLAWVKVPPVISRGERVRVVARRGSIRLTTTGEALNNASFGSFVRVRNLDSRKIVTGRANAPGVVELEF